MKSVFFFVLLSCTGPLLADGVGESGASVSVIPKEEKQDIILEEPLPQEKEGSHIPLKIRKGIVTEIIYGHPTEADLTFIIYFSVSCPHCRDFILSDEWATLKKKYFSESNPKNAQKKLAIVWRVVAFNPTDVPILLIASSLKKPDVAKNWVFKFLETSDEWLETFEDKLQELQKEFDKNPNSTDKHHRVSDLAFNIICEKAQKMEFPNPTLLKVKILYQQYQAMRDRLHILEQNLETQGLTKEAIHQKTQEERQAMKYFNNGFSAILDVCEERLPKIESLDGEKHLQWTVPKVYERKKNGEEVLIPKFVQDVLSQEFINERLGTINKKP